MDVRISQPGQIFKFRVGAIIKKDDKYLTVRINKNPFYCLIGGHVQLNEDTETALVREVKEELCVDITINELTCCFENFFRTKNNRKYHELCFAYDVELPSGITINDYTREEKENGETIKLEFKWLTLDEMKKNFKPKALVDVIEKNEFSHLIINQAN